MRAEQGLFNPILGQRFARKSGLRLLLVGFFDPHGVMTVRENIAALQQMSRHGVDVANLWPMDGERLALPSTLNLTDYDGIILHPTVSYNPDNICHIDRDLAHKLEDYEGIKVLMKQDEQFRTGRFARFIADKRFDVVVTCLPPSEWEKVYPREVVGDCRIIQSLTGFVSPEMRSDFWREPDAGRPVDVGYRGSLQPLSFGRLGLEKREIGEQFLKMVAETGAGLKCDISSRWEDRLSGRDWVSFLQSSRTTLGVESGSNLFDFDGQVEEKCARFAEENRGTDPWSRDYFEKAYQEFLHEYEGNVSYAQISPRHFEAAAAGSVQILYEGTYSGIFKPWQHYVPLKRDFSNFPEVVDVIRDHRKMRELALRAYEEIILNPEYTYQQFVGHFDEVVAETAQSKGLRRSQKTASHGGAKVEQKPTVFILVTQDPVQDPRIGWWTTKLLESFKVVEIGFYRPEQVRPEPTVEEIANDHARILLDPLAYGDAWLHFVDSDGKFERNPGLQVLKDLLLASTIGEQQVDTRFGLFGNSVQRSIFQSHLDYFVVLNSNLIEICERLGSPSAILACDLDTLPAGVALAKSWKIPLVYDAHEYWPFSFPNFTAGMSAFWQTVERTLVPHADLRICVSPQLSSIMQEAYGEPFVTVPNAVPLADAAPAIDVPQRHGRHDHVEFVFQGGFARTRGLDLLIRAWKKTSPRCVLILRGPDNDHKNEMRELAAQEGLLGSRIIFSDAVSEAQLIQAASQSDVGLIPYEPANLNNKYCCPNKLSQYMAAGLPILANKTEFIAGIIEDSQAGLCIDFRNEDALADAINRLAEDGALRKEMASRAQEYFLRNFNWDAVSADVLASIKDLVASADPNNSPDWSWIATRPYPHSARMTHRPIIGARWVQVVEDREAQVRRLQDVEAILQGEINRLQDVIVEVNETLKSSQSHFESPSRRVFQLGRRTLSKIRRRIYPGRAAN